MQEQIITKGDLLNLIARIDTKEFYIYSDNKWIYPKQGDDQKTCIMLDMNFKIERKAGIVVYIPNQIIEDYK